MLFLVQMNVQLPPDLDRAVRDELVATERARAQELQRAGTWRHLWRVAGRYENVSVFDVDGPAQLHELLSTLPLFPYMDIRVTALCRHPSSIHPDDR